MKNCCAQCNNSLCYRRPKGTTVVNVPYSRKHLRKKTFANWWKILFSWRKLSRAFLVPPTDTMHAPKFHKRKLSRIATIYGHTFNKYSPEWSSYFYILSMVTNELHWFLLNLLIKSHLFRQIFDISKSMTS